MSDNKKRQPTDRQRAIDATKMRVNGGTYQAIATALNYRDASGAYRAVSRLLDRQECESVGELRKVEGQRLDELQAALWPKATRGVLGAVREVVRIMERRCRLFGLDSPVTVAVEGVSAEEFRRATTELVAALAESEQPGSDRAAKLLLDGIPEAYRALEPAIRDQVYAEPPRVEPADSSWSNIGSPSMADVNVEDVEDVEEAVEVELPVAAVIVERAVDGGQDPQVTDDVETVVAEVIDDGQPRQPAQRRVASAEVLDANGAPIARTGIARRLGGYDPLQAWQP